MNTRKRIGVGAAAGIVGIGSLLGVALANAEDTSDASTPSASSTADPGPGMGHGGRGMQDMRGHHGEMNSDMAARLAAKLGMDETTVADAITATRDALRPSDMTERPSAADRQVHQAAFVTELAKQLGIDEATLTTAMDEMRAEASSARTADMQSRVDQAVADGTLTQAEGDAVMKAFEAGIIGFGKGRG